MFKPSVIPNMFLRLALVTRIRLQMPAVQTRPRATLKTS